MCTLRTWRRSDQVGQFGKDTSGDCDNKLTPASHAEISQYK